MKSVNYSISNSINYDVSKFRLKSDMYISRVLDVNYSSHCFILRLGTDRIGDVGIHSTSNEGFVKKRTERRIN